MGSAFSLSGNRPIHRTLQAVFIHIVSFIYFLKMLVNTINI